MDKGLETLYHKLSDLFHPTNSASPSAIPPAEPESSTLLPISTFFDRIIPSAASSQNNDRRRMSRQVSVQTNNNNRFTTHISKTIALDLIEEQQ